MKSAGACRHTKIAAYPALIIWLDASPKIGQYRSEDQFNKKVHQKKKNQRDQGHDIYVAKSFLALVAGIVKNLLAALGAPVGVLFAGETMAAFTDNLFGRQCRTQWMYSSCFKRRLRLACI